MNVWSNFVLLLYGRSWSHNNARHSGGLRRRLRLRHDSTQTRHPTTIVSCESIRRWNLCAPLKIPTYFNLQMYWQNILIEYIYVWNIKENSSYKGFFTKFKLISFGVPYHSKLLLEAWVNLSLLRQNCHHQKLIWRKKVENPLILIIWLITCHPDNVCRSVLVKEH